METERKYLQPDFELVRERLKALGAVGSGQHFERNIVLDTADKQLFGQNRLLRIRSQQWPDHAEYVLTFKYPPPELGKFEAAGVKAREELELKIDNATEMLRIFQLLGYKIVARYEKIRESWQAQWQDCVCTVDMDILPFMEAIEVEAPPKLQDSLALQLGLDKSKISLKNYYSLHQDWLGSTGLLQTDDILFLAEQKRQIPFFSLLNSAS